MRRVLGGPSQALLYDVILVPLQRRSPHSLEPGQKTKPLLHRLRLFIRKWEFALRHHHVPSRQYPFRWPPSGDTSARVQRHEPAAGSDATYRAWWSCGLALYSPPSFCSADAPDPSDTG
eukprot:5637159-Pleurochrysis_carterae.AAC.1